MEQFPQYPALPAGVYQTPSAESFDIDVEKIAAFQERRSSRVSSFFSKFSAPLPEKHHTRWIRHARHTVFNVYRRLFSLVFLLNIIGLCVFVARSQHYSKVIWLAIMADAAAANIMVAIVIRQDYIVNMLFRYVLEAELSGIY